MDIVLVTRDSEAVRIAQEIFGNTNRIFSLDDVGVSGEVAEEDFGELWAIYTHAESVRQKLPPQQDQAHVLAVRNAACFLFPCGTRKYIEPEVSSLPDDARFRTIFQAVHSAISTPKETEVEE